MQYMICYLTGRKVFDFLTLVVLHVEVLLLVKRLRVACLCFPRLVRNIHALHLKLTVLFFVFFFTLKIPGVSAYDLGMLYL